VAQKSVALLIKGINSTTGLEKNEIALNVGDENGPAPYKKIEVDFFKCYDNLKEKILDPLDEKFDLKIYLSTYDSKDFEKINNTLKPESFLLNALDNHPIDTFINGLRLISDVDYIIAYRFDAFLYNSILSLNMNYDLINIPWRERNHWGTIRGVGDLLFLYPFEYNDAFIAALEACKSKRSIHRIYDELASTISESKFNFMTDQMCNIVQGNNPIGYIDRVKILHG